MGLWGGGAALPPPRSSSKGPDPPASRLLPRSLSLPRTFPGQLGLKFSGEAAPSPWDKGAARLRPGPLPDLPLGSPGWLQGASLRGEAAAAVAPQIPGRAASGDRPGIRVQLQPGGGEGPPLTQHAATLPWLPRRAPGKASPRDPWAPRPGGGGRTPGSWRGDRAEPGVRGGGSLSAAAWPGRSSPPPLRHLPTAAPKLFAPAPSPQAAMQPPHPSPRARNGDPGARTPSAGLGRPRT